MLANPQPSYVDCAHGDGTESEAATARAVLGGKHGLTANGRASFLWAAEPIAGGGRFRRVCGAAVRELLCGKNGTTVAEPGPIFSLVTDGVFRRDRQ